MKSVLPKFAFALLGILVLAAILLTLGQKEREAKPSAYSYNPSGLHALQELLQKNGIETAVDRNDQPKLKTGDLVIAAYVEEGFSIFQQNRLEAIEKSLKRHLEKGGRVLAMPFDPNFRSRSLEAVKATTSVVNLRSGESLTVNTSPVTFGNLTSYEGSLSSNSSTFLSIDHTSFGYSPWMKRDVKSNEPFLAMAKTGKGLLARTADGLFATNRFIDRADNAQMALRIIQALVPEGGRVVFSEAAAGEGIEASLVSTLGPWAAGIWIQLLVLFVVIVFTLGIRFGLPDTEKKAQRGQREMLDAIGDVYRRARSTAVALDSAYVSADRRIRRGLKLPVHLSDQERDQLLPETLAQMMATVDHNRKPHIEVDKKGRQRVVYRVDPETARKMIERLESQLDEFVPKTKNRLS